ncbi:hypothetical protein PUN28_009079 [Cardiocondyla obscurior]|uniref:Uncharacterized protein n=1 Tax=Cardiocondyla obscurior TaxID=286306 RepID=A0AAW2FVF8_9HYME
MLGQNPSSFYHCSIPMNPLRYNRTGTKMKAHYRGHLTEGLDGRLTIASGSVVSRRPLLPLPP